ncbi:SDR family NAD(P)-dependent oxidoreductase (plasmid) [Streptomyces sp. CG1]|uniref:SDR family NAD(P)-dependent oxidoreductase n=1 Tax=Streptomyces sp. CG1 TaxID=1287523 RepID=UPI0034E280B3
MNIDLSERTALVTGTASGTGYAIAEALARAGAKVVIADRSRSHALSTVDRLCETTGAVDITGVVTDIATPDGVEDLAAAVPDVDILVNNVVVSATPLVLDVPDSEWRRFFETSVLAKIRLVRRYLPGMVRRGWGRVIFVSGGSLVQTSLETVHYGLVKSAHLSVARALAQSVAGTGVTVNSVLPGLTDPGGSDPAADRTGLGLRPPTAPLPGRLVQPCEVAGLVLYAVSDYGGATTGAALRLDCGAVPFLVP